MNAKDLVTADYVKAQIELAISDIGGGGTGDSLTESDVINIIRENTQQYLNEDTTLPPSVQCMVDYVNSMPYGDDIAGLRSELYDNYVSNEDLNYKVGQTDNYIRHDMRIENLELANGDISAALDAILAIHDELIGGDEA